MSSHRETREAAGAPSARAAGAGFLHHLYAATRETALVVALALVLSLVIKTWLLQASFLCFCGTMNSDGKISATWPRW